LRDNALFLNKGDWVFEDITQSAGVACAGVWSTGATMTLTLMETDGWIFMCVRQVNPEGDKRHNELFINQGDLTFKDKCIGIWTWISPDYPFTLHFLIMIKTEILTAIF
jgi:hypothetical protein